MDSELQTYLAGFKHLSQVPFYLGDFWLFKIRVMDVVG